MDKPEIFTYTIYRIPKDDELLDFVNYPNLQVDDIINGFTYTIVGRGIKSKENDFKIFKSIERLVELFPENNIYKQSLEKVSNKLNETSDVAKLNGKELNYDNDAYSFGYWLGIYDGHDNNDNFEYKMRVSKKNEAHFKIHKNYDDIQQTVYRYDFKFPGRIWVNEKVISFWKYPEKYELKKVLQDLQDELKEKHNLSLDLWNDFIIEIDDPENLYCTDKDVKNKEENFIKPKDYLGSENPSEEEFNKQHIISPLLKNKNKHIKYFGSSAKKDSERGAWTYAKTKYMGEKLNESPDYVKHGDLELNFDDEDAVIFGYYNGDFKYEEGGFTHTIYGYGRSDYKWQYPGRLWKNSKIITFWYYPSWEELKEIINELENKGLEIWNNNWRIEVIDNYKNIFNKEQELEHDLEWENDDFYLILIPLERYKEYWEEDKIVYSFPEKEIEKEHEISPLLKKNKYIKNFGSKSKKDIERGTWTYAKTKYMGEKLNESPDYVYYKDKYKLLHNNYDSALFGWLRGKFIYKDFEPNADFEKVGTFEVTSNMHSYYAHRGVWKYPGRLWKNSKIITFWDYPNFKDFKEIINLLEEKGNLKIWNNGWMVEVIININKFKKERLSMENDKSIVNKQLFKKTWDNEDFDLELISVDEYENYIKNGYLSYRFPEETFKTQHQVSPLLKYKNKQKVNKKDIPLAWKQAKLKSENLITKFKNF